MFHIGQKVVCVDDNPMSASKPYISYRGDLDGLTKGNIYTIRNTVFDATHGFACVWVNEIVRDRDCHFSECPFAAFRFRPVVERKTDTSMAILEEIRKRESEPAPAPRKKVEHSSTLSTE